VQINEHLTFDFADESENWGGPGFDPRTGRSQHYAFHVSDAEFDAIFSGVKAWGIPYGGGPFRHTDGQINTRRPQPLSPLRRTPSTIRRLATMNTTSSGTALSAAPAMIGP
jgi:hypothetical protein